MSLSLQLLLGGALFTAVYVTFDWTGVWIAAAILLALDVIHDLRLHRKPTNG